MSRDDAARDGEPHARRPSPVLAPFDETPNRGNAYVLAVCEQGATRFDQCHFDAFQIGADVPVLRAVVAGMVYYDANANGQFDPGEAGINEGAVTYWDGEQGVAHVALDGTFSTVVMPNELLFGQRPLGGSWMQTGNDISQAALVGDVTLRLQDDQIYNLTLSAGAVIDGVQFGDVCLGEGGSRPRGFWGLPYDPASIKDFQKWLHDDSSANQITQLSAQLAVAALNVHNGFVDGDALALMEATDTANNAGIGVVQRLIDETGQELGQHGVILPSEKAVIAYRDALLRALSGLNENTAFVQPNMLRCDAPDWVSFDPNIPHGIGGTGKQRTPDPRRRPAQPLACQPSVFSLNRRPWALTLSSRAASSIEPPAASRAPWIVSTGRSRAWRRSGMPAMASSRVFRATPRVAAARVTTQSLSSSARRTSSGRSPAVPTRRRLLTVPRVVGVAAPRSIRSRKAAGSVAVA